jgi:hypothetical protein
MAVRFQVLVNGKSICVAGIDGDGVLSVSLARVQRLGESERLRLFVRGLGRYYPQSEKDCHVHWPVPDDPKCGDEIGIRILAPGEFDDPGEVKRSPSAEINDPAFGPISYNVSTWDGLLPFSYPPARTTHVRVHIQATDSGPSPAQQEVFREFLSRYAQLWPSIAEALSRCHASLSSVDAVSRHVDPVVCLDLYASKPSQVELSYTFDVDRDQRRSYCVRIRDWRIVEIFSSD